MGKIERGRGTPVLPVTDSNTWIGALLGEGQNFSGPVVAVPLSVSPLFLSPRGATTHISTAI